MTNKIINSAVVVEDYKVQYTFQRNPPSKNLNAMGNFYKFVHQTKQIQSMTDGHKIIFDTMQLK